MIQFIFGPGETKSAFKFSSKITKFQKLKFKLQKEQIPRRRWNFHVYKIKTMKEIMSDSKLQEYHQ